MEGTLDMGLWGAVVRGVECELPLSGAVSVAKQMHWMRV